jgi:hypothetical protein
MAVVLATRGVAVVGASENRPHQTTSASYVTASLRRYELAVIHELMCPSIILLANVGTHSKT